MLLPYSSCSGLELFGLRFAVSLKKKNINAIVATDKNSIIAQECKKRNISVFHFQTANKYNVSSWDYCYKLLKQLKPRAVIAFRTQQLYPLQFARLLLKQHTKIYLFYRISPGKIFRKDPIHRYLFRNVAGVVPNSDYVSSRIFNYWGIDLSKVRCIKSGVDTNKYIPDQSLRLKFRRELKIEESTFLIGNTGRIEHKKGSEDLLRAVFEEGGAGYQNPHVKLVYAGRETINGYTQHLKNIAKELNASDRFIVLPFRSDVETLYPAFDIFALAVKVREAYAYTVLEAMACAKPVLVPSTGGLAEMIENEVEGWYYELNDFKKLKETINLAYSLDKEKLNNMGYKARERILNNASWEKMMNEYFNFFASNGLKL